MVKCAASWCEASSASSSFQFFEFPDENEPRCDIWKDFIKLEGEVSGLVLCSDHFADKYIGKDGELSLDGVPTIWKKSEEQIGDPLITGPNKKVIIKVVDNKKGHIEAQSSGGGTKELMTRANYLSGLMLSQRARGNTKSPVLARIAPKIVKLTPQPKASPSGPPTIRPVKGNTAKPSILDLKGKVRTFDTKPRIVHINPDKALMHKVKQSVISALEVPKKDSVSNQPKQQSIKHKENLLGEFLSFQRPNANQDNREMVESESPDDEEESIESIERAIQKALVKRDLEEAKRAAAKSKNMTDTEKSKVTITPKVVSLTQPSASKTAVKTANSRSPLITTPTGIKMAMNSRKVDSNIERVMNTLILTPHVPKSIASKSGGKTSHGNSNGPPQNVLKKNSQRASPVNTMNTVEFKCPSKKARVISLRTTKVIFNNGVLPLLSKPIEVRLKLNDYMEALNCDFADDAIVKFTPEHKEAQLKSSPFEDPSQRIVFAVYFVASEKMISITYSSEPMIEHLINPPRSKMIEEVKSQAKKKMEMKDLPKMTEEGTLESEDDYRPSSDSDMSGEGAQVLNVSTRSGRRAERKRGQASPQRGQKRTRGGGHHSANKHRKVLLEDTSDSDSSTPDVGGPADKQLQDMVKIKSDYSNVIVVPVNKQQPVLDNVMDCDSSDEENTDREPLATSEETFHDLMRKLRESFKRRSSNRPANEFAYCRPYIHTPCNRTAVVAEMKHFSANLKLIKDESRK